MSDLPPSYSFANRQGTEPFPPTAPAPYVVDAREQPGVQAVAGYGYVHSEPNKELPPSYRLDSADAYHPPTMGPQPGASIAMTTFHPQPKEPPVPSMKEPLIHHGHVRSHQVHGHRFVPAGKPGTCGCHECHAEMRRLADIEKERLEREDCERMCACLACCIYLFVAAATKGN